MIRQGILYFSSSSSPSRTVAGLSLLERGIRTMVRAGMKHVRVLLPAGPAPKLSRLTQKLDATVEFVSLDSAPPPSAFTAGGFMLVVGEYVHHHASLKNLLDENLGDSDLIAQVAEPPLEGVPPAEGGLLQPLHTTADNELVVGNTAAHELAASPQQRVSSGAFLMAAELLSDWQLLDSQLEFWSSLSRIAVGRSARLSEDSRALWRLVTVPRGSRAAKDMLFSQVTKSTSGPVSRKINARISIPTSKLLIETGISPHMVTVWLVLTTGLGAAYLVSQADKYAYLALAGLLWQFAAIFDRCDGEIARVKLCESKFGEWFDTLTDNIAYICAYFGMMLGMNRLFPDSTLHIYLGFSAITALIFTLGIMYAYAFKTGSGSLQNYLVGLAEVPDEKKGLVYRFMERYGFMAKRDFFSFVLSILILLNLLSVSYWIVVAGLHLVALAVLISQQEMLRTHAESSADRLGSQPASVAPVSSMAPGSFDESSTRKETG